jgi:hypothetical protein
VPVPDPVPVPVPPLADSHVPPTQSWLQQSEALLQLAPWAPQVGAPQVPALPQVPAQHWASVVHAAPLAEQDGAAHRPAVQVVLQHVLATEHGSPCAMHWVALHVPERHDPLQQSLNEWQEAPVLLHSLPPTGADFGAPPPLVAVGDGVGARGSDASGSPSHGPSALPLLHPVMTTMTRARAPNHQASIDDFMGSRHWQQAGQGANTEKCRRRGDLSGRNVERTGIQCGQVVARERRSGSLACAAQETHGCVMACEACLAFACS